MSVADYTSKIKDICDSLSSVDVKFEEDKMVQVCLGGLMSKFGAFLTTVCTRKNTPLFLDFQSMLLEDENHEGASPSTHADNKIFYMEVDRPHGCGGCGETALNGGRRQEQD